MNPQFETATPLLRFRAVHHSRLGCALEVTTAQRERCFTFELGMSQEATHTTACYLGALWTRSDLKGVVCVLTPFKECACELNRLRAFLAFASDVEGAMDAA